MIQYPKAQMPMILAIPKEVTADEKRVAVSHSNIAAFQKLGYEVHIEAGAGDAASQATPAEPLDSPRPVNDLLLGA